MKLLLILAAPFLMDAIDPGIVDAGGHGIVHGVDSAGSICASLDENGDHNCGDGVPDAMYIQKQGRSIVSSHGQAPPRAECRTIKCAYPLVVDHSKDALLCAGEVCDATGEDNENCCEGVATPKDVGQVVQGRPDNSSQQEKKDELAALFRLLDVDGSSELDIEELERGLFSQDKVESVQSEGENVSAASLGLSRTDAEDFLRSKTNGTGLSLAEFVATLDDEEDAEALVLAQKTACSWWQISVNLPYTSTKEIQNCVPSWNVWSWITSCAWKTVAVVKWKTHCVR